MTKKLFIILISLMMVGAVILTAGNGKGDGTGTCIFIDENGDGINDNFRDHDGDGIPNHDDPDWVRPQDGTGNGAQKGKLNRVRNRNMINATSSFNAFQHMFNFGTGVCDGTGTGTGTGSDNGSGKRKKGGRG